jgi:ParB family transcriptional regulator, chromosome partitioning protein
MGTHTAAATRACVGSTGTGGGVGRVGLEPPGETPSRLRVDLIDPSPRHPRRLLGRIDELANSIRACGLLQPVVVRPVGQRYELVAGHRWFAAVRRLGWTYVPALVRSAEQDAAYVLGIIENLQRGALTPQDQARALEVLVRERGWTTRQVAGAINRSPAYVSKRLRVFEDPVLAPLVIANRLSVTAAEELLRLEPTAKQDLAQRAADGEWERAQVRAAARTVPDVRQQERPRPGLQRRARELRRLLRGVLPRDLSPAQRRELRLLFMDLGVLARAPSDPGAIVFPSVE